MEASSFLHTDKSLQSILKNCAVLFKFPSLYFYFNYSRRVASLSDRVLNDGTLAYSNEHWNLDILLM